MKRETIEKRGGAMLLIGVVYLICDGSAEAFLDVMALRYPGLPRDIEVR